MHALTGIPPSRPWPRQMTSADDPGFDAREPRSASTEPGPNFVANEKRPGAIAQVAQGRQKAARRHDAAAPPEDGFDQDGAHVSASERHPDGSGRFVERAFARVRREDDVSGFSCSAKRPTETGLNPHAARAARATGAVVRPVERDDARPPVSQERPS